jgi:hypothetical protein
VDYTTHIRVNMSVSRASIDLIETRVQERNPSQQENIDDDVY